MIHVYRMVFMVMHNRLAQEKTHKVPVLTDWGYFPHTVPCFPAELTQKLIQQARLSGTLGNCHASGTTIIEELGEEHIKTGQPIIYTSADSVFQIAAHETYFGLEKLYKTCQIARILVDPYHIARVIARPFTGEKGHFIRTPRRRDYATPPPTQTLLDHILAEGGHVIAIGKIADIFAHQGISEVVKAPSDDALFTATLNALSTTPSKGLIFTNFVDFDSVYGHRRDSAGYARALEAFDQRLPELFDAMEPEDLLIISADHGCDPSWQGSDHTREVIPVLSFGKRLTAQSIGERQSFADIGQSIASYLNLPALQYGKSFLNG
jgi:phosphopentomutase